MLAEDEWPVGAAAHRLCGCVEAQEIIPAIAREEPFDVQMEYVLWAGKKDCILAENRLYCFQLRGGGCHGAFAAAV